MNRRLDRRYRFTASEVNEIIIAHLRSKDIPAPQYVATNPHCIWVMDTDGVEVSWTDEDSVDLQ